MLSAEKDVRFVYAGLHTARAFHTARTQPVLTTTGRFSDLRSTSRFLPVPAGQWFRHLSDFRFAIGTNAYSGATVADFHRVPIFTIPANYPEPAIECYLAKEQC